MELLFCDMSLFKEHSKVAGTYSNISNMGNKFTYLPRVCDTKKNRVSEFSTLIFSTTLPSFEPFR